MTQSSPVYEVPQHCPSRSSPSVHGPKSTAETEARLVRRGRISQAAYVRAVGRMLTQDWYALDRCEILTQLELVDQLVSAYPTRYLSKGAAVRAILDKAVDQVITACRQSLDNGSVRTVAFLEARRQGTSIADIAREWGLSREYISRRIGKQATRLVTDRVLALGRRKLALHKPVGSVIADVARQSA